MKDRQDGRTGHWDRCGSGASACAAADQVVTIPDKILERMDALPSLLITREEVPPLC